MCMSPQGQDPAKMLAALGKATALVGGLMAIRNGMNMARDAIFPKDVKPHRIYTPREVARHLRVSRAEVLELITSGQLHGRQVNGRMLVLGINVERFLNS